MIRQTPVDRQNYFGFRLFATYDNHNFLPLVSERMVVCFPPDPCHLKMGK